ncbi:5406_t:CDS:2 [Entrophospora sp. SA101]|nr:5406_t:CDS:2 [Entrophospora sp. SA101]
MDYPTHHQMLVPQSNSRVVPIPQRRPSSSPSPQRDRESSLPITPQRRSAGNSPMSSIETMVTQLLVTTKALLESLTGWAAKRVNQQQVSDIYVKLVSEFNTVIQLFSQTGVDISDLTNIPTNLRACLEKALSEEASQNSLEKHLPTIKETIVSLLKGLKAKQALYKQIHNPPPRCDLVVPNTADPMAALIHTENLERRASRRFSAYTMQKGSGKRIASRMNKQEILRPPSPEHRVVEMTKEEMPTPTTILTDQANQHINNSKDEEKKKGIKLFLQLGNEVKKLQYDGDISIPTLRILFIEKFQYNPGMDDFPNIYIKDPNVGIMYELEDLNEVTDNSVLALNVEALEQIKKHIDQNIGELTKEIREIKKSFSENTKLLRHNSIIANNTPPSPRPSESHFTQLAKKVLENVKKQKDSDDKKVTEEHVLKVAKEIKDQYDEVQNLRRDLGVMRQVYTEFQENSKKTFETLLARTENFKKVALTKNISSARTFIEAGKAKVDSKTRALLTKVDDLQDLIDNLKLDVVQRRSKPKDTIIQHVKNESASVREELASLQEYLKSVKPMWKKTWEDELNVIVDEQKFLNHQEELIEDLMDDDNKLTEVFEQILKVINIQIKNKKEFFVKPQEEGFEGLKTVLQEVKGIAPDHNRRLKALEQAEKQREIDLANSIDEFEAELTSFVSENKLKKTGGAQEIERLRQKKNEENLKALFKFLNKKSQIEINMPLNFDQTKLEKSNIKPEDVFTEE